jgi:hypothetical protein
MRIPTSILCLALAFVASAPNARASGTGAHSSEAKPTEQAIQREALNLLRRDVAAVARFAPTRLSVIGHYALVPLAFLACRENQVIRHINPAWTNAASGALTETEQAVERYQAKYGPIPARMAWKIARLKKRVEARRAGYAAKERARTLLGETQKAAQSILREDDSDRYPPEL